MKKETNSRGMSMLVEDLMSMDLMTRQAALGQIANMMDRQALEALEEAIRRLTGKQHIEFHTWGGMPTRIGTRTITPQQAYDQILKMARQGKLSDDPAFVQSLIPAVGAMHQKLMTELGSVDAKALAIYQLLGMQMQIKIWVR